MQTTTGVRMDQSKRDRLEEIGRPYHMTTSALMRLAVDNLIAATDANGGELPASIEAMRETAKPEAAAAPTRLVLAPVHPRPQR